MPYSGRRTLAVALENRDRNNFDFLRLAAALLVIWSHCYVLVDVRPDERWGFRYYEPFRAVTGHDTAGMLAVRVFFIISGLLVARSFLMEPSAIRYATKRGLRIFPGLIACILLTILVIGPLTTSLSLGEYFASKQTWTYLVNASLLPKNQYVLPGVFEGHVNSTVNGSLWSLPLEVIMYVGVVGLGVLSLLRRWFVLPMAIIALVAHLTVMKSIDWSGLPMSGFLEHWVPKVIEYGWFFFAGTAMLLFKEHVKLDRRTFIACSAALLLTLPPVLSRIAPPLASNAATISFIVYALTLPYVVLYLSFARLSFIPDTKKMGDLSYGTYLYGWLGQQLVIHYFGPVSVPTLFIFASLATLVAAAISWHLVEKPFLRLKSKPRDNRPASNAPTAHELAANAIEHSPPLGVSGPIGTPPSPHHVPTNAAPPASPSAI